MKICPDFTEEIGLSFVKSAPGSLVGVARHAGYSSGACAANAMYRSRARVAIGPTGSERDS